MAIKRFTFEIDDSLDRINPTHVPESLTGRELTEIKQHGATEIPTNEDRMDNSEYSKEIPHNPPTIGRTFPDLVIEFIKNPRAMSTLLVFVPFIIFVGQIKSIESLKYPIIVGIILNVVWFGVPILLKLLNWFRNKIFRKKQ